jgi:hypothetical protein
MEANVGTKPHARYTKKELSVASRLLIDSTAANIEGSRVPSPGRSRTTLSSAILQQRGTSVMGKNFTTAFALCLAISALPLACGDDEDDDGGSSKGGNGGSGGSSTGGRGGSAGSGPTGGRGGNAGSTTGGRGGSAGSGGMTGGTAGSATGGMGGADGGMGGDGMGGEGGNGGPQTFTCEQVCERAIAATDCADNSMCEVEVCAPSAGPSCDDEVQAFHDCAGMEPDSSFSCLLGKPIYNYSTGGGCDAEFDAALLCIPE